MLPYQIRIYWSRATDFNCRGAISILRASSMNGQVEQIKASRSSDALSRFTSPKLRRVACENYFALGI